VNVLTWLRSEWDRVAGYGLVLLGALFLLLGYHGVKTSPFLAEELAFIASGGLGGIFCLGLGVGLLLSADLHDEWRKLDRIEAAIREQGMAGLEPARAATRENVLSTPVEVSRRADGLRPTTAAGRSS